MAIEYQEIIQSSSTDHVTGIAEYSDPDGQGKYKIYVTGKREEIKLYAEQATILSMQIARADNHDDRVSKPRITILRELLQRRQRQIKRLKMFLPILSSEKLENMADEEWQKLKAEFTDKHEHKLDWEHDRLIEIEVLDPPLKPNELYDLSYTIDPTVVTESCDVYTLRHNAWSAKAKIDIHLGDPDLYLYDDDSMVDSSESRPGECEKVSGGGYLATWRVHVYGKSTARYTIYGRWVIIDDDVPDYRH